LPWFRKPELAGDFTGKPGSAAMVAVAYVVDTCRGIQRHATTTRQVIDVDSVSRVRICFRKHGLLVTQAFFAESARAVNAG